MKIKEDELKMEHALDILNRRVAKFIREHKDKNFKNFKEELEKYALEEEKIYLLNQETIDKVINEYLKELKKRGN